MYKFLITLGAVVMAMTTPTFAHATESGPVAVNCRAIDAKYISDPAYVQAINQACSPGGSVASNVTPDDVRKWASLGKDFSNAVTDTARGLGVTANELLTTPVGFLLAFYFMWDMIGGVIIGIPLLFFIWWLFLRGFRAMVISGCMVKYDYKPYLWGMWQRKVIVESEPGTGGLEGYLIFGGGAAVLFTLLDISMLIF